MATITPPTSARARNLGEYQRRVRSPLAQLRGYIRGYVSLEGALLLVLLLALCFWVGLTLDYGLFKAVGFDWVQDWSWVVRLVLLVLATGGVAAIVAVAVLTRLTREFRDTALALVLERRFPQLLGDRLITAVELADLRRAEEQGYSPAMVLETIHEAAERVQRVPIAKVFDWRRLVYRGVLAVGLTLGLYVLAGGLFLILDLTGHVHSGRIGYSRFNEVVQMWFERNVLLRHTLWPRQAQLEFVNVPERGLRVGQGDTVPQVRLRALEYVVADPDPNSRDGWRALTWDELMERSDLLGSDVPNIRQVGHDPGSSLTVDEVALALGKWDAQSRAPDQEGPNGWQVAEDEVTDLGDVKVVRAGKGKWRDLKSEDLPYVQDALDRLNARAAQPDMSRTLRRLDVPENVRLYGSGGANAPQEKLDRNGDNEYAYNFTDLKDSISFTVQADDYITPPRSITLVPAPALEKLQEQESRPAYLFYRPDEATTLAFLRGQKQPFQSRNILEVGSDNSRLDVPAGTDLVLTGTATKDLSEAFLVLPAKTTEEIPQLRIRIDPSKVEAGEPTSRFFGIEAMLGVKSVPGEPRDVVVQPSKKDEKGEIKKGESIRLPLEIGSAPIKLADGRQTSAPRTFQVELPDVRRSTSFTLEFTDTDGVKGISKVDVAVQADAAPDLKEVSIKDLRTMPTKTDRKVYLVTPKARIPLTARIGDDHCLGEVLYHYTLTPVPPTPPSGSTTAEAPNRAPDAPVRDVEATPAVFSAAAAGFLGSPLGQGPLLAASAAIPTKIVYSYSPPEFQERVIDAKDGLALAEVRKLLQEPQQLPFRQMMLKRDAEVAADTITVGYDDPRPPQRRTWHDAQELGTPERPVNPLHWDFPLWQQNVVLDADRPFYRMDFWLEAADTDADDLTSPSGAPQPHRSKSKETFTFLVVREDYLMEQIGQDEAQQYKVLNNQFQTLGGLATDFETFQSEAEDLTKRLKAGGQAETAQQVQDFAQEVSDKVATYHKVPDVDKFLLGSGPYLQLDKRVNTGLEENERLEKMLEDNPPDAADLRRQIRDNEDFKDSIQALVGLLQGFREEKSALTQVVEKINTRDVKIGELLTQDVQVDNISKALDRAREALSARGKVLDVYEGLVREEQLNVIDKQNIDYTQKRIVDKLRVILQSDFPTAEKAVAKFRKALTEQLPGQTDQDRIDRSREVAKNLQAPMTQLVTDLYDVLEAIRRNQNRQSLKKTLESIDKGVVEVKKYADQVDKYLLDHIFDNPP